MERLPIGDLNRLRTGGDERCQKPLERFSWGGGIFELPGIFTGDTLQGSKHHAAGEFILFYLKAFLSHFSLLLQRAQGS